MFEKCVYFTPVNTFRCSEWSILKICFLKILLLGRGIHSGVEGAGTNRTNTGGVIVYEIIGWKITTLRGDKML